MKLATVLSLAMAIWAAGSSFAETANWLPTSGGSYAWNSNANWDTVNFPNAAGVVANMEVSLLGNQTISLGQAITVGSLHAGDTGGTPGSGTSLTGNSLTFEGTSPGDETFLNFNLTAKPSGNGLSLPNVRLGGTSPMTVNIDTPATVAVYGAITQLDLNGNTFTLEGTRRADPGLGTDYGFRFDINTLTGDGNYIQNGGGTRIVYNSPNFTGTVTINNGMFIFEQGSLKGATEYTIAGAWGNFTKYPRGGFLAVGSGGFPTYTSLPDRLNHDARMVFKCGYLQYAGQRLDASLAGQAVIEQVRQIEFASGMSQIRMSNGNSVSSYSALLANDPENSCVRRQGATLMIGGDDTASKGGTYWLAMGVVEKLLFASGMDQYLIGAGGADGSMSKSIIPWMTNGTIYHPSQGRFVTYDNTNGIRCLTLEEYYYVPDTGTIYGIDPTYNVCTTSAQASGSILYLGSGNTQTINSLSTDSTVNMDIGAGSTLTITSGAVHFGRAGTIGMTPSSAGTLDFGPAEGIIWTLFESTVGPNKIGSVIAGSGGLTMAGNNELILTAVNTYTGKTCIGSGIMTVGNGSLTTSRLGDGDVDVAAGGTLRIKSNVSNAIMDTAKVSLGNNGDVFFGMLDLENGINESVGGLILNGVTQPAGTYGSSASAATYKLDEYFSGTGVLTVTGQVLFVDAGNEATITLPVDTVNLDGTVLDAGLPPAPGSDIEWTVQSGPAAVTFGDAHAIDTPATFTQAGTYVLRLTVDNGTQTAYDEVTIRVHPAPLSITLDYTAEELGNDLTAYTFKIRNNDGLSQSYALTVAFEAMDTASIRQVKAFGAVRVDREEDATNYSAMPTANYVKAEDTWVFSPFSNNGIPGVSPLDGTTFSGFVEGPSDAYYMLSAGSGSGSQLGDNVSAVYVVCDGNVSWSGVLARIGVSYPVSGVTETVVVVLPGDYNGDGYVDLADYTIWADNYGQTGSNVPGDGNNDGVVDLADYTLWADHYGQGTPAAMTAGDDVAAEVVYGTPVSGGASQGDFNGDGFVDQADYTLWADGDASADANGDGVVDLADYTIWSDHFGS